MKKRIFLVGIIATISLSAFLISCENEEDKSCSCREFNAAGKQLGGVSNFYPSSWGAKDCSELQTKLRVQALDLGLNNTFSCN